MLSRRTFLTTIAAAPLAAFCKTEPVHFGFDPGRDEGRMIVCAEWDRKAGRFARFHLPAREVERRYALPQGTLG